VLGALLAVGVAGLLLGFWFRAPALAAAAAIVAMTNITVALAGDWSLQRAAVSLLVLLVGLSCAYLLGLLIAFTWSKLKKNSHDG
jgi:hypothetical protein